MTELEKQAEEYANSISNTNLEKLIAEKAYIKGFQDANQWVSVSEQLPECHEQHGNVYYSGRILIYGDEGIETAEFLTYPSFAEWSGCHGKVTHWMPLPDKPLK